MHGYVSSSRSGGSEGRGGDSDRARTGPFAETAFLKSADAITCARSHLLLGGKPVHRSASSRAATADIADRSLGGFTSQHRPSIRRSSGAAGLCALVVVFAALLASCASPVPRPSMAEVLDGQATAEVRSAAVGLVEQWPQGLSAAGVGLVARQTYTGCREGQNNWKVKDGYRLQCSAHSLVYFGWNGDYAAGRDRMLAAMASFCTVTGLENVPAGTPDGDSTLVGPNYSCSPGLDGQSMLLSGRASKVLIGPDSWGVTYGEQRWVAGPQGDALLKQLRSRRWLFAVDVSSVFFQDAP